MVTFHVAPLPSCSGTRMSESLCRCTFYLRLKLLATKLHLLYQITKSVFGRLRHEIHFETTCFIKEIVRNHLQRVIRAILAERQNYIFEIYLHDW